MGVNQQTKSNANGDTVNDSTSNSPQSHDEEKMDSSSSVSADCEPSASVSDSERFERLMLRVAALKKINTSLIEEVFFRDVIGNVQIDSIVPSIIGQDTETSHTVSEASADAVEATKANSEDD